MVGPRTASCMDALDRTCGIMILGKKIISAHCTQEAIQKTLFQGTSDPKLRGPHFNLRVHCSEPELVGGWAVAKVIVCDYVDPVARAPAEAPQQQGGAPLGHVVHADRGPLLLGQPLEHGLLVVKCHTAHPDRLVVLDHDEGHLVGHHALV